jgi:hypothetical protein
MVSMSLKSRWQYLSESVAARIALIALGVLLMITAPLVGPLPGPGGSILFVVGLGLVLRNSLWAKRRYVLFKRRYPKSGGWADWGLRRQSAKRRQDLVKRKDGSSSSKTD